MTRQPLIESAAATRAPRSVPQHILACAAGALAVLSTWLAFGAVAPPGATSSDRLAFLPCGLAPAATVLLVGVLATWLVRAHRTAPLWLLTFSLLPWVPFPATGALLMWHGAAAGVLFAAVGLLLAWPAFARGAQWIGSRPIGHQAVLVFVTAACLYAASAWRMQPQLPGGDEPHYLVITQSLLLDGDLQIENNHQRGDYTSYTTQVLKPDSLKRGLNGQIYSIHAPGVSALVLPAFAIGGYWLVVVWLALLAACGSVVLWDTARHVTGSSGAAWIGWAATALSAPFFFHAFTVYPDGPGAVIVMLLVSALAAPERLRRPIVCAFLGGAAAFLPWLHTRFAIVAGVAGVLILARVVAGTDRRWLRVCAFVAVPLLSFAGWLWFFYAVYGTPNPAAPYGGYTQSTLGNVPRGVTGLLLDQQFGLLPNAPVFVAALGGMAALWRLRPRVAVELVLIVVPYAIAVACYHMWWGGRSAPVRFLVPVLLPLGVPVAAWWRLAGPAGRALAGASALASVALALGLAWVARGALVFNVRDGYALWADALVPLARWPLALPSVFRAGPATAWLIAAAWAGWLGGAAAALRWAESRRNSRLGGDFAGADGWRTLVAATCCALVTGASATTWAFTRADSVQVGSGLLRVLGEAAAGSGYGWRASEPLRALEPGALVRSLDLPTAERRGPAAATELWAGSDMPPGRYELRSISDLRVSGRLTVLFGRSGTPLAEGNWQDVPPGVLPLAIDLPAGATRLCVISDADAARTIGALHLRLAAPVHPSGISMPRYASGVLRSPTGVTAWFVDGYAFVEPSGFWVRGGATTTIVMDGGSGSGELVLRAGPVATVCEVAWAGADVIHVPLGPGAFEAIRVPAGPTVVRIGSTGGFRPHDHDPRTPDARWLGVRVDLH